MLLHERCAMFIRAEILLVSDASGRKCGRERGWLAVGAASRVRAKRDRPVTQVCGRAWCLFLLLLLFRSSFFSLLADKHRLTSWHFAATEDAEKSTHSPSLP